LCGDHTAVQRFESLAEAASRVLTDVPDLSTHKFADEITDLFRSPFGGIRYVFGDVSNPPPHFMANGWQAGQLIYEHGVLIDMPIAESEPGIGHWLLLLHRLSWLRLPGSPLRGKRLAWHENTTVPYEWVIQQEFHTDLPEHWRERFAEIPTTSYYSVLGEREHPLDVNLASAFAIELMLSQNPKTDDGANRSTPRADYSAEEWYKLPIPPLVPGVATDLRRQIKPKIILLTATQTERDTVLRHLQPLPDLAAIARVFHANNTYFLGRLGQYSVVLCLCSMGSSGRDSSQIVTSEVIRFWKPAALIMVGIAFGRDPNRQAIGDVLVSDRIIAYEPEKVGESAIPRGQQFLAGPRLFNRFRDATVDWSFRNPGGVLCTRYLGPILSGEKLIDNLDFKSGLFRAHPNALGGEMEGAGFAAAADREKCEWIVVKGICDWADGNKDDQHQGFAAASALSLVQHVLSQPGVLKS
jgi:nucleoside phosphorylase